MSFLFLLRTALMGLRTNKSRSALTVLGIVIGITAIIMVMAIGKGAENLIVKEIQGFGSRTVMIEPGKDPTSLSDMYDAIYADSLVDRDVSVLQKSANVRGLSKISPMVVSSKIVSFQNENKRIQLVGGDDLYLEILNVDVEEGSMFGEGEVKQMSRVAVIGSEIRDDFFGFSDAVGKKIKLANQYFRVVGVMPKSGTMFGQDIDKMVMVPYSTAQKYILGIGYYHAFITQAESAEVVADMAADMRITLRESHGITDPEKDDFHVTTMDEAADRIGTMMTALTVLLVSVSAISLIVGGVGIMNIMLVSVTERTKEIGLRKALGATSGDILRQFLLESIILTGVGGVVGIAFGSGLSFLLAYLITNFGGMDWEFVFPVWGMILGLGVSATVGLVFGIYPARQAAKKSPIEALRYE